jgi:Asp-tRNA(Asn)/Glu-tRNA(Gln) amidotransferase A subunit family amidase
MGATDVLNMTISEAAAQVERRTLSPVELTDAMVHRIAAVDKALNATSRSAVKRRARWRRRRRR